MGAVFSSLLSILDEYEQDHTTNISVRENRLARLECAVSALNQALPLASGVSASAELRSFRQRVSSPTVSSPTTWDDSPTFLCHMLGQFANDLGRFANVLMSHLMSVRQRL